MTDEELIAVARLHRKAAPTIRNGKLDDAARERLIEILRQEKR
jgi:hypothetical protein